MHILKALIITALAVVGYLLILQWNEDYVSGANSVTNTTSPSTSNVSTPADSVDVPITIDLPSAPTLSNGVPVVDAATQSSDLIEVNTDTLVVNIDPVGGDIVYLALKAYPQAVNTPEQPFVLLQRSDQHVYIAQSGFRIRESQSRPTASAKPRYATKLKHYELIDGQDTLEVKLVHEQPDHTTITKSFTFSKGSYVIAVDFSVNNLSDKVWSGEHYSQIKRDGSKDPSEGGGFGLPTFLGAAYWTAEKPYTKVEFEDMPAGSFFKQVIPGGWVAMIQHYFVTAWIPSPEQQHTYFYNKGSDGHYRIGFVSPTLHVQPGQISQAGVTMYAGPKVQQTLEALSPGLNLSIDYGFLFFISDALFKFLKFLYSYVGNWGVAIILLTLCIKLLFYKLSATSYRSMAKMREVQPEMLRIRDLYADDKQRLSQEMMKLYRDKKINPLGGCLPILVQMPVFLALYWALLESVELRQASFLWIKDLSAMDPYFILPILMGASMFIQQMFNPTPPDPMQAKIMRYMPVVFTVFFLFFPAGLVLYWLTNNVLSIAQQWFITRSVQASSSSASAKP